MQLNFSWDGRGALGWCLEYFCLYWRCFWRIRLMMALLVCPPPAPAAPAGCLVDASNFFPAWPRTLALRSVAAAGRREDYSSLLEGEREIGGFDSFHRSQDSRGGYRDRWDIFGEGWVTVGVQTRSTQSVTFRYSWLASQCHEPTGSRNSQVCLHCLLLERRLTCAQPDDSHSKIVNIFFVTQWPWTSLAPLQGYLSSVWWILLVSIDGVESGNGGHERLNDWLN